MLLRFCLIAVYIFAALALALQPAVAANKHDMQGANPTLTPTPSKPGPTDSPSPSPTPSPTPTPSATPSSTPQPSATPSATATPTPSPTISPSITPTPSPTDTPKAVVGQAGDTPSPTPSPSPSTGVLGVSAQAVSDQPNIFEKSAHEAVSALIAPPQALLENRALGQFYKDHGLPQQTTGIALALAVVGLITGLILYLTYKPSHYAGRASLKRRARRSIQRLSYRLNMFL